MEICTRSNKYRYTFTKIQSDTKDEATDNMLLMLASLRVLGVASIAWLKWVRLWVRLVNEAESELAQQLDLCCM